MGKRVVPRDAKMQSKKRNHFLKILVIQKLIISACPVHRSHSFIKWMQKAGVFTDVAKNEKQDFAFRRLVEETTDELKVSIEPGAVECLAAKLAVIRDWGRKSKLSVFLVMGATR